MKQGVLIMAVIASWLGSGGLLAQGVRGRQPFVTRWAKDVSADNPLPEYPRPAMVRSEWTNLNGAWDFGISPAGQTNMGALTNRILVPFPIGTRFSPVRIRIFTDRDRAWYRRKFSIPPDWRNRRVLLHFEAVDWETRVWVNGHDLGIHQGGYDRFTFDITDALRADGEQELVVSVLDPTDGGSQPRGKQSLRPRDIFYSSCSGIWETVWLEPVANTSIESLKLVPDIDAGVLRVTVLGRGETNGITVETVALEDGHEVGHASGAVEKEFALPVPHPRLWSPDSPFLYDLKVILRRNGQKLDEVASYFGMRQIAVAKDAGGFQRLMLNHQPVFELGTLDQGYWPDGIYTAPTDEALRSDIEAMKKLGFNMCRKHVKIEPERWYYWCDKLGLLVWQDMPSGDRPAGSPRPEIVRNSESARQFELELRRMIEGRGNHPSIVMWIVFNQGWGQYDTAKLTASVKEWDPSRLVVGASGYYDLGQGDVCSLHVYPGPATPRPDGVRAYVLGECGAFGFAVREHMRQPAMSFWNQTKCENVEELTAHYESLLSDLQTLEIKNGLSGAVITEWTDVETECDGIMTYDREVIKMPVERVKAANQKVLGIRSVPVTK